MAKVPRLSGVGRSSGGLSDLYNLGRQMTSPPQMEQGVPMSRQIGQQIGTIAGSALGQTLQGLAQTKIEEIQKQKKQEQQQKLIQQYTPLLQQMGLSEEEIPAMGMLMLNDPKLAQDLLGKMQQQKQMEQYGRLASQEVAPSGVEPDISEEQPPSFADSPEVVAVNEQINEIKRQAQSGILKVPQANKEIARLKKEKESKIRYLKEKEAEATLGEKKLSQKDLSDSRKFYLDLSKDVREKAKGAQSQLDTAKVMEVYEDSGALNDEKYVSFLNGFGKVLGMDLTPLLNPTSQAYQGLMKEFLTQVRSIFGARPTQFEVQEFLKSLPQLVNSPKARKLIRKNMQRMLHLKVQEKDELVKLRKEYDAEKKPYWGIEDQLDEKMEGNRVEAWDKFTNEIDEVLGKDYKKSMKFQIPKDAQVGEYFNDGENEYILDENLKPLTIEEYTSKYGKVPENG